LILVEDFLREFRSAKLAAAFIVVGLVLAIDVVWLANSSFQLRQHTLQWSVLVALVAAALMPSVKNQAIRTLICGYLLLTIAWPTLRIFNHLTFTISGDYVDAMLARWDEVFRLPWAAYVSWLDEHPRFTLFISTAYGSLTPLSIAAFIAVAFVCPKDVAEEYLLLFVILAVAVSVIGIFLPAYGPMVYFDDVTSKLRHLGTAGHIHVPVYDGYRAGTLQIMQLEGLMGLTTFPSFHTAMGCLMVYTSRHRLLLLVPATIYSAMMIAGALVFGSHYFVDLFGGLAVTVAAVLFVRWASKLSRPVLLDAQPDAICQPGASAK
jgi:hypothetical protein